MGAFDRIGIPSGRTRKLYGLTQKGQSYVRLMEGDSSEKADDLIIYALYNRGACDLDDLANATRIDKERVHAIAKHLVTRGYVEVRT